jgi:hypothetical protein
MPPHPLVTEVAHSVVQTVRTPSSPGGVVQSGMGEAKPYPRSITPSQQRNSNLTAGPSPAPLKLLGKPFQPKPR